MQWFLMVLSISIVLIGLYLIATSQWMQLSDARAQAYQTGKPVHTRLRDGRAFVVSPDGRAVIVSPDGRVTHDTLSEPVLDTPGSPDTLTVSAWVNEPDTLTHSVSLTSQASQPDTPASKPANYYETLLSHLDTPVRPAGETVNHPDAPVRQVHETVTHSVKPAIRPVHSDDTPGRFNTSQVLPTPVPASYYHDTPVSPDTPARPEGTKRERAVSLLARGMTQAEVADTLGISQQMVSKYKRASERNRMKWA